MRGAQGLTALNLAIAVFGLINGTGMMLGAGGAARYMILKTQGKNQEADQVFTGISQGIQPLLGRAFGKGREEEIRWLYRAGSVLCICLGAGTLMLAYGCTEQLVSLFNSENDRMLQRLAEAGNRMPDLGFQRMRWRHCRRSGFFCIFRDERDLDFLFGDGRDRVFDRKVFCTVGKSGRGGKEVSGSQKEVSGILTSKGK